LKLLTADIGGLLASLNAQVFERGWLSSNNILFNDGLGKFTVVDTGAAVHAAQSLKLVELALAPRSGELTRIVNTHLHSDHCGGNAALQGRWQCDVLVPIASEQDVRSWSDDELSYSYTGQDCERFALTGAMEAGSRVDLGGRAWYAIAAPGHDHKALMFFNPETATLIAGDALWEQRLAVIFPELAMESGFDATAETLSVIERLAPKLVIPGHGSPFTDVMGAIEASRQRLAKFIQAPEAHAKYAARSLLMFHLLQSRQQEESGLRQHLLNTQVFIDIAGKLQISTSSLADQIIDRLMADGLLKRQGTLIVCR